MASAVVETGILVRIAGFRFWLDVSTGARPDIKNVRGKTALIHAEDLEFCKIVEILTASSA